jgi:hypothetical protein
MLNCPYYDSTLIFESINNSNNLNKLQIKMKLKCFFMGDIDYLKVTHYFFLTWNVRWFGLTPNAYGISKLSLQFGERHENLKKSWTYQVDNQNEGIIS